MTPTQLVKSLERDLDNAMRAELKAKAQIESMIASYKARGLDDFSEADAATAEELFAAIERSKAEQEKIAGQLVRAKEVEREDREQEIENERRMQERSPSKKDGDKKMATAEFHVGNEEREFRPDRDPEGQDFLLQVARSHIFHDPAASERLERHNRQMRATGVSSDFPGLVIPQYLVDLTAFAASTRRNFADAAHSSHPMPAEGLKFEIPKGTATSVAEQTAELTEVSHTQAGTSLLEVSVRTYAGYQIVSRQSVERGRLDQFLTRDLMVRQAAALEKGCLQTATYGALAVANAVPFAGTDQEDLLQAIVKASGDVETILEGAPATHVVMDSETYAWMSGFLTPNHMLIGNGLNPGQARGVEYGPSVRAVLPNGLGVVVSNGVPLDAASKHQVLIVPQSECHLWEDNPMMIRAEQPYANELGILLVAYEYAAFEYRRYDDALQLVNGIAIA